MKRDFRDYANDILEALNEIEEFTRGFTRDRFLADRRTVNAVIRSLEVLGEASRMIPDRIRTSFPQIPWTRMTGMRNKLVHGAAEPQPKGTRAPTSRFEVHPQITQITQMKREHGHGQSAESV